MGGGKQRRGSGATNKATIPGPWRSRQELLEGAAGSVASAASSPELHAKPDTYVISCNPTTLLLPPVTEGNLNLREGRTWPGSHSREGRPRTWPWCVWWHCPVDTQQPAGPAVPTGRTVSALSRTPS